MEFDVMYHGAGGAGQGGLLVADGRWLFQFAICVMELLCTKDMSVVKCCQQMFHVSSDLIKKISVKFESKCDTLSVS